MKLNMNDLLSKNLCYDPRSRIQTWPDELELVDLVDFPGFTMRDKIYTAMKFMTDGQRRAFMVKVAEAMLAEMTLEEELPFETMDALETARKYAAGTATDAELEIARSTAFAAAKTMNTQNSRTAALIIARACGPGERIITTAQTEELQKRILKEHIVAIGLGPSGQ